MGKCYFFGIVYVYYWILIREKNTLQCNDLFYSNTYLHDSNASFIKMKFTSCLAEIYKNAPNLVKKIADWFAM